MRPSLWISFKSMFSGLVATLGCSGCLVGVLYLFGSATHFEFWPIGILAGVGLQWALLRWRTEGLRRRWLAHPGWNDFFTHLLFYCPVLESLRFERHYWLDARQTGAQLLEETEQDWLRVLGGKRLGRFFYYGTALARLVRLETLQRWARDQERTQALSRRTGRSLRVAEGLSMLLPVALVFGFGLGAELLLFWVLPWFTVGAWFQERHSRTPHSTSRFTSFRPAVIRLVR